MTRLSFKPAQADAELSITVPDDERGTLFTLWGMAAFADDAAANSPEVKAIARSIRRFTGTPYGDVYDYLARHVRFQYDPDAFEWVRHPEHMAREILDNGYAMGDCDDTAALGAALLRVLGARPCFFVAGTDAVGPFTHVTWGVVVNGRPVPLDSQHHYFGRFPAFARRITPFLW